ncbi:MAG TPA: serine/threonine-protein kinase [Micromonosporaceae bacterium]|nr:serine/threonine-protein kinase [Micromonosporaceae bacterium]
MVLARGGYATVYRATQESVSREVAVKVENRALASERDQRRFLREARAAGRMSSHPHVVDLFDAGVTTEGHPYLIMELCDGSYADRIRAAPLPPYEVRDVGVKIADALADAHALGVLHRDVKPANLLVSRFGEPALADFGLAILAETRDTSVTLDVLTPAYAPPELFRHHAPSSCVDVYALAATLYALLSGRPPRWRRDRNPSLLTLLELFDEPIPDLPGVPGSLVNLLRLGMLNDPDARPTAEQLRDLLATLDLAAEPPTVPMGWQAVAPRSPGPAPVSPGPQAGWAVPGGWQGDLGEETIAHPLLPGPPRQPAGPQYPPPGPAHAPGSPPHPPAGPPHIPGGGPRPPAGPAPSAPAPAPASTKPCSRHRWRRWLGLGGTLAAVVLLAAGVWYAVAQPAPAPAKTQQARPVVTQLTGDPAIGACLLAAVQARCLDPDRPECYGRLTVSRGVARAEALPCEQAHTWEVFALAELPAALKGAPYAMVARAGHVRQVCNATNLLVVDLRTAGWHVAVLPPTTSEYDAGRRDFRCLAGRGEDELVGATLGHDG